MKKHKFLLVLSLTIIMILVVAGCSTQTQSSPTPQTPSSTNTSSKTEPVKVVSLVDQVKSTQHYKMFPTLIAEAEKDPKFHYADNCIKCHAQVSILGDKNAKMVDFFKGGKYENQREGITCIVCHNVGGKDMFTLRKDDWTTCTQCHTTDKPTVILGSQLHHSQKEMIEGTAVGSNAAMPSYKWATMKDNFSCTDCHVTNNEKHDFKIPGLTVTYDALGTTRTDTKMDWDKFATMFNQPKCITCHADPKSTVDKVKAQTEEIAKKLDALRPTYEEWTKKAATITDKNDPKLVAFNNGATYFTFVEADASKGAHNYAYAKELLKNCETEWAKLK